MHAVGFCEESLYSSIFFVFHSTYMNSYNEEPRIVRVLYMM